MSRGLLSIISRVILMLPLVMRPSTSSMISMRASSVLPGGSSTTFTPSASRYPTPTSLIGSVTTTVKPVILGTGEKKRL